MVAPVTIPTSSVVLPWQAGLLAWPALVLLIARRWHRNMLSGDAVVLQIGLCVCGLSYWLVAIGAVGPLPWETAVRSVCTAGSLVAFVIELAVFTWPLYRRSHGIGIA